MKHSNELPANRQISCNITAYTVVGGRRKKVQIINLNQTSLRIVAGEALAMSDQFAVDFTISIAGMLATIVFVANVTRRHKISPGYYELDLEIYKIGEGVARDLGDYLASYYH